MKHPEDSIVLQAVEFWSTVCEEEIELGIEAAEVRSAGDVVRMRPRSSAVFDFLMPTCVPESKKPLGNADSGRVL